MIRHRAFIVGTDGEEESLFYRSKPCFRFEANWVHEECEPLVENAWKGSINGRVGSVHDVVKAVANDLWDWSKNIMGDLEKRIKILKRYRIMQES
jgi:hypothetical protein